MKHLIITNLFKDTLQIYGSSFPEVKLHKWPWVMAFQQRLSWISFQNTLYLVSPINNDWLNGMNQATVKWLTSKHQTDKILVNDQ